MQGLGRGASRKESGGRALGLGDTGSFVPPRPPFGEGGVGGGPQPIRQAPRVWARELSCLHLRQERGPGGCERAVSAGVLSQHRWHAGSQDTWADSTEQGGAGPAGRGQLGHSSLCVPLTSAGPSCFLAGALSLSCPPRLDFEHCDTPPPSNLLSPLPPRPPPGPDTELLWRAVLGQG